MSPGNRIRVPSAEKERILAVMKECNCSEQEASKALKIHKNNVERAKRQQHWLNEIRRTKLSRIQKSISDLSQEVAPKGEREKSSRGPKVEFGRDTGCVEYDEDWHSAAEDEPKVEGGHQEHTIGADLEERQDLASDTNLTPSGHQDDGSLASGDMEKEETLPEWDFVLPTLKQPKAWPQDPDEHPPFDLEHLVQHIQYGATSRVVENYFAEFDKSIVSREINREIRGFPAMFYVVARNDEAMLRSWVRRGGNVHSEHAASKTPLLAFAVVHNKNKQEDMTLVVATLLALGAAPEVIPKEFYESYTEDLPLDGPETIDQSVSEYAWCTVAVRKRLGRTMNVSQRYFLCNTAKLGRPTARAKQVALRKHAEGVLEIPYLLIGQAVAAQRGLHRFLDEFEKTTPDIHQALLLPFDNGDYQDRRDQMNVNCSKTIWILATNALDSRILSFCDRNEDIIIGDEITKARLGSELSDELRKGFIDRFGAPVTGRISDISPFVPFSLGEQIAVTHRFIREVIESVRGPVNLAEGSKEKLVGDVVLHVKHDASICKTVAEAEYSRDLGARSLSRAVEEIEDRLVEVYLDQSDEIVEGSKMMDVVIDAHDGKILVTPV